MIKSIIALLVMGSCSICHGQEMEMPESIKIDSMFTYYFDVLDSYVDKTDTDRSAGRIQIISNLERLSGILADGDGTYVGKLDFSRKNLLDWKDWYSIHKEELVWNNEKKQVDTRKTKMK